ncbi:MAG: ABC transporter substrate-binding protein [Ewingella americana]|jgi:iron complex transport system substrate-binding protein|uniref:heme/hemin ABC transporter substrate-binding protein n=1 Tax=Ewingella americana TaxID=41202 RepID=UPI000C2FA7E7|nr:ABC transporter substrate-binding protein [Ewingella americana]MCI1679056.1 ABC transporter substrate-binding protein [Ewingella americana]MCI1852300.1 ABC transporter substrate-binding protein [Ewingella americana]MCI1862702.1 ABC transporter substrate-binding protein [Ewingella americana]MCI2142868.1 ABC transporter substrate-binding protein [Ewingella americana]MCI2163360.1 ABC transporter substrate-binding protein [Ewingella americana]
MKRRLSAWVIALAGACAPLAQAAERLVSIGGDVTEIVYALGAGDEVVARDSTSLNPEQVKKLPNVGYMRQLNAEGILAMKPSLVLSSELAEPSLVLQQVAQNGVKVVRIPGNTTLDTVPQKIEVIADALNRQQEGEKLIATYRQKLAVVPHSPLPVKILFVMNHGGTNAMAAGQHTAADAMITAAGAQNAMQGFSRYRPLAQEGIIASAPDILMVTTDGVRSLGGIEQVWKLPGVALTPAGKNHRVLVLDDMALLGFGLETPDVLVKIRQAAEQVK